MLGDHAFPAKTAARSASLQYSPCPKRYAAAAKRNLHDTLFKLSTALGTILDFTHALTPLSYFVKLDVTTFVADLSFCLKRIEVT
jgi:hypothetical protein